MIFATEGLDEAFHVEVDVKSEAVYRWSVLGNVTQEVFGSQGDGTSIDLEEPFVIRCCPVLLSLAHPTSGLGVMRTAGC